MTTFQCHCTRGRGLKQTAFFVPAKAIRMNPHTDIGARVFRQRRIEHANEICFAQTTARNREVAVGLIHHQDQRHLPPQ
ncbi:hypothetical protein D3C71_1717250 [compost metagenome]